MSYQEELNVDWLKKRKITTIAFVILNVFIGLDYGIYAANLWLYIVGLVKPNNPKLYYSLLSLTYLLSTSVFSLVISKVADETRNIRRLLFLTNLALICGNLMYMLPFSPWLLFFGCFLRGVGHPQRSIMIGEIARSYSTEQLTFLFSINAAAVDFGFMIAPGINIALNGLDVWIGKWHVTYLNVSGLYMAAIYLSSQLITFFLISDLSKEYDLKGHNEGKGLLTETVSSRRYSETDGEEYTDESLLIPKNDDGLEEFSEERIEEAKLPGRENEIDICTLLKQLMSHHDTALILVLTAFDSLLTMTLEMSLAILITGYLEWTTKAYNIIMLATGLTSILPCIYLIFKSMSDRVVYYISIATVFFYGILQVIQIIWAARCASNETNIILSAIYVCLFANVMILKDIFLSGFLARMVSSHYQASTDGIRETFAMLGSIVGMSSAPYALEKINIIGPVYICIMTIIGCLLVVRHQTLKRPQIIIHYEKTIVQ